MLPQQSQYDLSESQNPGTPFEDAMETFREQPRLTPTNDTESNQSFHTATSDINTDGVAPVSPATLGSSVDLADGRDDIGIFYSQSSNMTLWDVFEHM